MKMSGISKISMYLSLLILAGCSVFNPAPMAFKNNYYLTDSEIKNIQVYVDVYEKSSVDLLNKLNSKSAKFYYTVGNTSEQRDINYGQGSIVKETVNTQNYVYLNVGTPGVIVSRSYGSVDVDFGDGLIVNFVPTSFTWGNCYRINSAKKNGIDLTFDNNQGGIFYLRSDQNIEVKSVYKTNKTETVAPGKTVR
jgi:hypothetical protein